MTNSVIENIRCSLERKELGLLGQRPAIYPSRQPGTKSEEIDRFLDEINKISGVAQKLERENILCALESLVSANGVRKATVWQTARFEQLGIENILNHLGVDVIPSTAEKHQIALCDLGITEADFLLPETGTLVLNSSAEKPRVTSLLPKIHLAIVHSGMLRTDLHQIFGEISVPPNYLVFITGPSRTADIELTVTLGVHGPKVLYVWMID